MCAPKCEATKAGITPPAVGTPEFEAWRKSVDPDAMGFDGQEVGNDSDNRETTNPI